MYANSNTACQTPTNAKVSPNTAASADFPAVTGKLLVAIALLCRTTVATAGNKKPPHGKV